MKRGYAICSAPRSGTNFFCEVLTSTGMLGHPREYFNTLARRKHDDPAYPDDPRLQIERVLTAGATGDIYGLKLFPGLFDTVSPHIKLTECLPGLRFIRFHRRDRLGQALSWLRSTQTQQFRSTETPQGAPSYNADAISFYLSQVCQRNARWDMFFARTGIAPLELAYEDVAADPQAGVDTVALAMGLSGAVTYQPALMPLRVQRDTVSAQWRERYIAERGDLNMIEPVEFLALT